LPKPLSRRETSNARKPPVSGASKEAPEQRKGFGKVPKYLEKFKEQKHELELKKAREQEMKSCPPGTRRMDDDERMKILTELKQTKKDLEMEIMKFPISMKTIAI